jgi:hypothetical protein
VSGPMTLHDIDEIGFQRREWALQRVAWVVMLAVVVAALAGFFGVGSVSSTTAESADGSIQVEYDRFVRYDGKSTLSLSLSPDAVEGGKATVYLSRDLVGHWKVEAVTPTPSTESSSEEWVIYEYDVLGETPPRVQLRYRSSDLGRQAGSIRAGQDGDPVDVWQWTHP